MFLLGTADKLLEESYAQSFAKAMPSAATRVIEGAGHDIQNMAPEAFPEESGERLRSLAGRLRLA